MADVTIKNNTDESRYEAWLGDQLAGFAEYRLTDELIIFPHTVVEPAYEGQGIASAIVRHSLDEVRAEGTRKVMPLCAFYKGWIAKHREYVPLVYGA